LEYRKGEKLRVCNVGSRQTARPLYQYPLHSRCITDEECKPFCLDCGSPCIELCPNPDCRVRILDVLLESDLQSCPRCGEKWMYDPDRPDADQKCCE
jgi:hypothetical protein